MSAKFLKSTVLAFSLISYLLPIQIASGADAAMPAESATAISDSADDTIWLDDKKTIVKQLKPNVLKIFQEGNQIKLSPTQEAAVRGKVKEETGLESPRPLAKKEMAKRKKAFRQGKAADYSVQDLIDAGVFKFRPIANVHPKALTSDEDKSLLPRDGKELEVENSVWGKKKIPAELKFGVMHSTEDGFADAAMTIDIWNKDCAAGLRSSSTPFVLGRCLHGPDIYVCSDFETRWSRHCSSKLTSRDSLVNWSSIGIEMEHSTEKNIDYTKAETKEAALLWTYIQERAKLADNNIITHGEIQGHLPKDHKSYRTDPEGFDWKLFGKEMAKLRRNANFAPPPSAASDKTKPQAAIESALAHN